MEVDEDFHTSLHKESRDGFFPYVSMNSNEGILLHNLSLKQNDSRINSLLHTHPVCLGHKRKLNTIEKIT